MIFFDFQPIVAIVIGFALLSARAQEPAPPSKAVTAEPAAARPFLWRIEGGKPSYIFGSIHLPSKRLVELPPSVQSAFDEAAAVYCEIPLDPDSTTQVTKATISTTKPLPEILPPDLYQRTDAALKRISPALSLGMLDDVALWALPVELISLDAELKAPMTIPLDLRIYQSAQAAGKEVGGIETVEEQLKALRSFSAAEQLEMLRGALDEMDAAAARGATCSGELLAAYLSGDLEALDRTMQGALAHYSPSVRHHFEESLLTSRNQLMAGRIADKLRAAPGKSQFFVLRVAHFAGKESVIERLQAAGFKIVRVAE